MSVTAFADAAGISRKHLSMIVNGRVSITADTAVRISAVLGTSAEMWMIGQAQYDLWYSEKALPEGKPLKRGAFALTSQEVHA